MNGERILLTPYSGGSSHGNPTVAVLAGLISFFVRFMKLPKATYGVSTAGLFQFWLGLGLASRWYACSLAIGTARSSADNVSGSVG